MVMQEKLSAFVVTYNRASLLETCLRAVSFVDELIVVDKSSTDNSAEIAARYADRVEVVPWSPTVEETRAFALSLCRHEWVLFLDDDEILSSAAELYLRNNLSDWEADIIAIPLRHYILGTHDERAYYWPEQHHRLFRRGAIEFLPTVHGGVALQSERIAGIPTDSGVCIHHLSYQDVASWIDRTNRYTSRPDRIRVADETGNLLRFAHARIDFWLQRTTDPSGDDYPTTVALLRAIYDMVDRLKTWEAERGVDVAAMFRAAQLNLLPVTDGKGRHVGASEGLGRGPAGMADVRADSADGKHDELQATLVQLRATEAQLRERTEAARKSSLSLAGTRNELDQAIGALVATRADLGQTQAKLEQTRATLEQTRAMLEQTRLELDKTRGCLTEVALESARLSGSARLFFRQYWPKLRHHLSRRLS